VSQEFFVPPCRLALGREGGMGRKRCAPGTVRCPHAIKEGRVAAEGVKCRAMGCRIDEPVLIELTLDLDEAVAELAEEADADRLVVDEGAAAPVRRQHPAQEERLLARELLACEHRPCRMVARELEGRGDAGLAGTLAHELGTPLNSVLGYVQLLAGDEVKSEQVERLRIIESQVRRMVDTIRSVLDRTRDAPVTRAPLAFGALVSDTLTLLASRFRARGVAVSVDVPSTLPSVRGDAIGLRQVLINLLTNALDAIEGVGAIEIRAAALTRSDQRGLQVEISVHDSGRGMTAEELVHAFEPFYTTKAAGRGTGLGLMIVEQIVHAHGGHLKAESTPGRGTTIRVFLPVEA